MTADDMLRQLRQLRESIDDQAPAFIARPRGRLHVSNYVPHGDVLVAEGFKPAGIAFGGRSLEPPPEVGPFVFLSASTLAEIRRRAPWVSDAIIASFYVYKAEIAELEKAAAP